MRRLFNSSILSSISLLTCSKTGSTIPTSRLFLTNHSCSKRLQLILATYVPDWGIILRSPSFSRLTIASLAGVLETLYLTAIFCALIESPGTSLKFMISYFNFSYVSSFNDFSITLRPFLYYEPACYIY